MAIKREDIRLNDDGSADWTMSVVGRDGTLYKGLFKFTTSLSPMQMIAADRDYRRLLGEHMAFASDQVANDAFHLAQLKQRVIQSPPFWTEKGGEFGGGHIAEVDVLKTAMDAAVLAQELRGEALKKQADASVETIREALGAFAKQQREDAKAAAAEEAGPSET